VQIVVKRLGFFRRANQSEAKLGKEPTHGKRIVGWAVIGNAADRMGRPDQSRASLVREHKLRLCELDAAVFHERLKRSRYFGDLTALRQANLAEHGRAANLKPEAGTAIAREFVDRFVVLREQNGSPVHDGPVE
jgi:hypothetical protein